jgi:hypothetical protein
LQSLRASLKIIERFQNHVLPKSKVQRHDLHHDYTSEKREAWRLLEDRLSLILNLNDHDAVARTVQHSNVGCTLIGA